MMVISKVYSKSHRQEMQALNKKKILTELQPPNQDACMCLTWSRRCIYLILHICICYKFFVKIAFRPRDAEKSHRIRSFIYILTHLRHKIIQSVRIFEGLIKCKNPLTKLLWGQEKDIKEKERREEKTETEKEIIGKK